MNKVLVLLICVLLLPVVMAAYDHDANPLGATHSYNGTIDTTATDNIGSVNMTVNTGVSQVECSGLGTGTQCFNFTNTNGGLNHSYDYLNGLDNWSISLWLKAYEPTVGEQVIITDKGTSNGFIVQYAGTGTGRMYLYTNTAGAGVQWTNIEDVMNIYDMAWHQFGVTYNGSIMRLYFDGENKYNYSSPSGRIISTSGNLRFGAESSTGDRPFKGDMTDIVIWNNTVLSDYDMLTLSRSFNVFNDTYYFTPPIDFNALHNDFDYVNEVLIDRGISPVSINSIGGKSEVDVLNLFIYAKQSNLYLIFRDFLTGNVVNYTNISLNLISDDQSGNYLITTGYTTINITNLGNYRIDYEEVGTNLVGYTTSSSYIDLSAFEDKTHLVYLENLTTTYNITAQVYDQNDKPLIDAYIYVMRYDIYTNSYLTTEVQKTNYNGVTILHITPITEKYIFMIEYGGQFVYTSPTQQIIYDPTSTIVFRVNTGEDYLEHKDNIQNIDGIVSYTNSSNTTGYFRYTVDSSREAYVCLKVFRFSKSGYDLYSQSCGQATVGSFVVDVNVSTYGSDVTLIGQGYAKFDTSDYDILIDSYTKHFKIDNNIDDLVTDSFGFYLALIIIIISIFLFIYKPEIGIIMMVFGLVAIYKYDLISTTYDVIIGLVMILLISLFIIKRRGD